MFSVLKDFFKTLWMEIRGSKVVPKEVSFEPPTVLGIGVGIEDPGVIDETVGVEIERISFGERVHVVEGSFKSEGVDISDISFRQSSVTVSSGMGFFDVGILSGGSGLNVEVSKITPSFETPVVRDVGSETDVVSFIDAEPIWEIVLEPSAEVRREKILEAIERFMKKHGGSLDGVRFVGYFKNVPITSVERIVVFEGKLSVRLKRSRKKLSRVDVVVFKTPMGLDMEVV